jgi:hypothetical protein
MKIRRSQLKQVIEEELSKTLKEMGTPSQLMMDLANEMEAPDGTSPEDVARELVASGQEVSDEAIDNAVVAAGVLDDYIPDFADAVWQEIQRLSVQTEGRYLPGSVYDPQGEPEIASPFRDKPKKSYGSGLSDVDKKAWEKRQAERDPDREYINMVKGIMRGMPGARVTASPNNERQNRLLAQAEEEFAMEQQQ